MKKIFKGLVCAGLCGVMALGAGAAGCRTSEKRDPEKSPLKLAIGAVDQKFNPLFYTSQNDGEIANMTQIPLVTSKADQNDLKHPYIAVGEDQPTVALDYTETYYSGTEVVARGDGKDIISGDTSTADTTVYEFLIKNDIKFSDGTPLTVMDVLFNLYVYLDPAYSGSSTIYSTKIKGLQAYRQQNRNADEDSNLSLLQYRPRALERLNALIDWSDRGGTLNDDQKKDLDKVKELYKEELETDWNSIETSWEESYKDEYRFTAAWQVFYYIEGVVKNQTEISEETNTSVNRKDENGKYLTTLDPDDREGGNIVHQNLIDEMKGVLSETAIDAFIKANEGATREYAELALQKNFVLEEVYKQNTLDNVIKDILTYNATRTTALDYFMMDEMSKDVPADGLTVETISGITVDHTADAEHNGTFNGKTYAEDHDILRVEIKGIDPKAKWNFGFSVAPMHYYSGSYGGVNYVEEAMSDYNNNKLYDDTATHFGVKFKDINFMNEVLAGKSKNGLPMGAGAYKCTTHGAVSGRKVNLTAQTFFYNNVAYFERNEEFTSLGSGIDNANIKFITYRVISDDKIVEALKTKEIDFGQPVATANNQRALMGNGLEQITYLTGGYGYVGINPKYVPDIEVRRAIMHSFNLSSINTFYGGSLVNLINRPVSTTSWAYPEGSTRYYEGYSDPQQIIDLVDSSPNWSYNEVDKKFYKRGSTTPLKLTFTIAGATTDHPSYRMFKDAEEFLEECGFEITVQTDVQALKKLTTGDLAVWAAAWSSSIDPDPYQIYSINSNATSTKNWYKDGIMADSTTYGTEYAIAQEINDLIVAGRATLNEATRIGIYEQCFNKIMELAVEFPTYQRFDLSVYNSNVLDGNSMHINDASFNMGPLGEIWKVNFVK